MRPSTMVKSDKVVILADGDGGAEDFGLGLYSRECLERAKTG